MAGTMTDTKAKDGGDGTGEVLFRWQHKTDEASSVSVSGLWSEWSEIIPLSMERDVFGRGKLFSGTIRVPYGKHLFRFFVDGEWRHDPQLRSERDGDTGHLCNVVEVTHDSPFRLQMPEKSAPEESAEEADLINSFREYGLRTDRGNRRLPNAEVDHKNRGSSHPSCTTQPFTTTGDDGIVDGNSLQYTLGGVVKAAAAAAGGIGVVDGNGGRNISNQESGVIEPPSSGKVLDNNQMVSVNMATLGLGMIADIVDGSDDQRNSQVAREQAAPAASVSYRREQASAAVGACLVTSSVRKDGKLLVAMVGIPARGKTFVARAIARHLDWVGLRCRIFSVGEHRRRELGVWQPTAYFEQGGEGEQTRKRIAGEVLNEALEALKLDIDIAIYDGSNVTRERRTWLSDAVESSGLHAQVVFIESICNDERMVQRNIREVRRTSPEYEDKKADEAEQHYKDRIVEYQRISEPLEASEGYSFIKLIDVGSQMVTNLISGYIPGRITLLCLNLHLNPRPIWMSRHGESEFNMQGRIGGDAPLTAAGKVYANKLAEFMKILYPTQSTGAEAGHEEELAVWTSTMLRTGQTVAPMTKDREVIKWSQLSEINAGLMDSLTYEYVAENMPQEYEARQTDKLSYRYPGGESYQDLFTRLEPVLFEMLRQRSPLLVVGHQAILRVLYGYFTGKNPSECPTLHMPLHTAIKLTPKAYTCEEEWYLPLEECGEPTSDSKHPVSDIQSA